MHAKCLIKCSLDIFALIWTPMSTKLWGLACLLNCNMFLSLLVYFTHFAPWVLVHALLMHYTCTLDAHTLSQLTCHAYCHAFCLIRPLALFSCLYVLVYALLSSFKEFSTWFLF